MSRSEPKPKIIYKNLEDLIKSNSISKNNKRYHTQRNHTQGLADTTNQTIPIFNQVKEFKYIRVGKTQANDHQQENFIAKVDIYSNCYNQIDAIFTQLEDFFCQSKQKILEQIRTVLRAKSQKIKEQRIIKQKVEDIKKMSDYIKHISKYFIDGQVPEITSNAGQDCFYQTKNQMGPSKSTIPTESYEDQSSKLLALSMKNSKLRANRRCEIMNNRKKTVYELILEQKQNKMRPGSSSKKNLEKIS